MKFSQDPIESLTQINLDDLVSSFGWEKSPLLARVLRSVFRRPAKKLAKMMLVFDEEIQAKGLASASENLLKLFVKRVRVYGAENLPDGSFIALSNHPGMVDTLVLFAALQCSDLKIIATYNPFLASLVNCNESLEFITDDASARIGLVRRVSAHLRNGGAILTFPAGEIEPDPDVYPGAKNALQSWTDSAAVFMRFSPQSKVVPVLVRGVIWSRTANHWLIKVSGKNQVDQEKMAAALQILAHIVCNKRPLDVVVQIGNPISMTAGEKMNKGAIHRAVIDEMNRLLDEPLGKNFEEVF